MGDRTIFYNGVCERGSAHQPNNKVKLSSQVANHAVLVGTAVMVANPHGSGDGLMHVLNGHHLKKGNPTAYDPTVVISVAIESRECRLPYHYTFGGMESPPATFGEMNLRVCTRGIGVLYVDIFWMDRIYLSQCIALSTEAKGNGPAPLKEAVPATGTGKVTSSRGAAPSEDLTVISEDGENIFASSRCATSS